MFFVGCIDQSADSIGNCTNVADTAGIRLQGQRTGGVEVGGTRPESRESERCGDVRDSMCRGCPGDERRREYAESPDGRGRAIEPGLGGMAHGFSTGVDGMLSIWDSESDELPVATGVPNRKQRIKCLGNAVVPQQAYPIFRALREELEWQDAAGEEER